MAKYLSLIIKGPIKLPLFGVLYGVEGIGKTTMGDMLPEVVFVGPERLSARLMGARFPRPKNWNEFKEQLRELLLPEYKFKSLVVDSLDHAEQLLFEHMKVEWKVKAVEDAGGSFGKWVGIAQRQWLEVLGVLDQLRYNKGMNILLIAHYEIKVFNDPLTTLPYDRYKMKLNDKCAAIIREAVDFVFFANFKSTSFSSDAKAKKGRGLSDGVRVVYTERRASHDAKNSFDMPEEVPFDFNTIMSYVNSSPTDKLTSIQKDIEALMLDIKSVEQLASIKTFYESNKNDLPTLQSIKNRLKTIVGEELVDAPE